MKAAFLNAILVPFTVLTLTLPAFAQDSVALAPTPDRPLQTSGLSPKAPRSEEQHDHKHDHEKDLWAITDEELAVHMQQTEEYRKRLLAALEKAVEYGVDAQDLQRPYRNDSDTEAVRIPRSILNEVVQAAVEVELAQEKLYVFCSHKCSHSLMKDGATPEEVRFIRKVWPFVASSFRRLFVDLPVGIWERAIHFKTYSRSVAARARYQSQAYGTLPMTLGAATFGVTFGLTEAAEGPFHLFCQANYLWAAAWGAAVASASRELKTLVSFESSTSSFSTRLFSLATRHKSVKSWKAVEERILFTSITGDMKKISHKNALVQKFNHLFEGRKPTQFSAASFIAKDKLLWSELLARLDRSMDQTWTEEVTELKSVSFDEDFSKIFEPNGLRYWQDLHASLRVILASFKHTLEARHVASNDQAFQLKTLGRLDRELNALNVFMKLWNPKSSAGSESKKLWLQRIVSEWLALAIDVTAKPPLTERQLASVRLRMSSLTETLKESIRLAEPVDFSPDGRSDLSRAIGGSCQAAFQ